YKQFGAWGTEITGYKAVSVWHDFRYPNEEVITGAADTWAYDHLGIYGWTTEFWSAMREAGLTEYHLIDWYENHPIEDDLALLRWSDEKLGGRGFVSWYPFNHPQLGAIELGGWDEINVLSNPPTEYLEAEITPHAEWVIVCALATPRLELHSISATKLGNDL